MLLLMFTVLLLIGYCLIDLTSGFLFGFAFSFDFGCWCLILSLVYDFLITFDLLVLWWIIVGFWFYFGLLGLHVAVVCFDVVVG